MPQAFTGIHLGAITATIWMLFLNSVVGFQLIDDGTPLSMGLILGSAAAFFVGTGYIALDTGYDWTGTFSSSNNRPNNRNIALYVLYQLWPLICLFLFFVLETVLVLRVLGEKKPMSMLCSHCFGTCSKADCPSVYLLAAVLLFAIGQVFQYVISRYICTGTDGKIDGALFETLFTLLSVVMIWVFWSSITEDDWPMPVTETTDYT